MTYKNLGIEVLDYEWNLEDDDVDEIHDDDNDNWHKDI